MYYLLQETNLNENKIKSLCAGKEHSTYANCLGACRVNKACIVTGRWCGIVHSITYESITLIIWKIKLEIQANAALSLCSWAVVKIIFNRTSLLNLSWFTKFCKTNSAYRFLLWIIEPSAMKCTKPLWSKSELLCNEVWKKSFDVYRTTTFLLADVKIKLPLLLLKTKPPVI